MERIIYAILYAYAEQNKILGSEQDEFRKYRGTTQSLLVLFRLSLNIEN